jgi:hypothetical protein
LEQAEGTDAIRPEPVLNAGEDFSFQDRNESEEREKNCEQRGDIEQTGNGLANPIGRTCQRRQEPLLCEDENLIQKTAHLGRKRARSDFFSKTGMKNGPESRESSRAALRFRNVALSEAIKFCFVPPAEALFVMAKKSQDRFRFVRRE